MLKQIPATFQINGQDAIPLRLVPYATGGAVSPVGLAQVLALPDTILQAYAIQPGTNNVTPIPPKDWQITAKQLSAADRPTNEPCLDLPASTFVWLRDLDNACDHYFMPDRREPGWTPGERDAMQISSTVLLEEQLAETLWAGFPTFSGSGLPATSKQPSPIKRQIEQEDEIIQTLKDLGYDPMKLPKYTPGRPDFKRDVKVKIGTQGMWAGSSVFNKAWDRLGSKNRIARI